MTEKKIVRMEINRIDRNKIAKEKKIDREKIEKTEKIWREKKQNERKSPQSSRRPDQPQCVPHMIIREVCCSREGFRMRGWVATAAESARKASGEGQEAGLVFVSIVINHMVRIHTVIMIINVVRMVMIVNDDNGVRNNENNNCMQNSNSGNANSNDKDNNNSNDKDNHNDDCNECNVSDDFNKGDDNNHKNSRKS